MDGFPLLTLAPIIFEKTVSKCKLDGYLRLRQTCRDVNDIITNSRNISVFLEDYTNFCFDKKLGSWVLTRLIGNTFFKMDMEAFRGFTLEQVAINGEHHIEALCDSLKKHRITCEELDVTEKSWKPENYALLFETLKPKKLFMESLELLPFIHFEELLSSKTLKIIRLMVHSHDMDGMMERFLSKFQKVDFDCVYCLTPFSLLISFAQLLNSKPFPNLQKFVFAVLFEFEFDRTDLPYDVDEIEDKLRERLEERGVQVVTAREGYMVTAEIALPAHFPAGSTCSIVIDGSDNGKIVFQRG